MKQKLTLLIAAASLALPLSASTTDSLRTANIDEVLVYGTRSILPLKKVPSKIEVISAETIQRSGFTSLPDLLKNYSSVDVIQYPGFNATVGIRGFKPGKAYTTVLINGIPTASENISTIALSDIAQVEILKGPFSSVYGTNAMAVSSTSSPYSTRSSSRAASPLRLVATTPTPVRSLSVGASSRACPSTSAPATPASTRTTRRVTTISSVTTASPRLS